MDAMIDSGKRRLLYALGAMSAIIVALIVAILVFVSFGPGPSLPRALAGVFLSLFTFVLLWKAMDEPVPVKASWLGIISGMTSWMVIGEISHHFGFVAIEDEGGMVLLIFMTLIVLMLWRKDILTWGLKVYFSSFLLNWWGHAILLPQLFLAHELNMSIFMTTYFLTGLVCLVLFVALLLYIYRKPASRGQLVYYGLLLYVLLVTGIEGVTRITERTFGH